MQKSRLDWCLAKEGRLKRIKPDLAKAQGHLFKAKHNLLAADYNHKGGFGDWVISQTYYAMYHALLAVLYAFGYESKNHECTLTAVEELIALGKVALDMEDIAFIRTAEQMKPQDAKAMREEFQYGMETDVNQEILRLHLARSKEFIEKVEIALQ